MKGSSFINKDIKIELSGIIVNNSSFNEKFLSYELTHYNMSEISIYKKIEEITKYQTILIRILNSNEIKYIFKVYFSNIISISSFILESVNFFRFKWCLYQDKKSEINIYEFLNSISLDDLLLYMNNFKDSIQNELLNMTIILNLLLHLYKLPPELYINKSKEIKDKKKYNEDSYKIEEIINNKFDFKNNIINNNNKINKKENEECINNNSIDINVKEEISYCSETNMDNKDVMSKHFSIYMDDKKEIDNNSNIIKNTNIKKSEINNFEIKKKDISKSDYKKKKKTEENNMKKNQNLNHDKSNKNKINPIDKNENQSNNHVQNNIANNRRIRKEKAKKQFCNEDQNCCQIL